MGKERKEETFISVEISVNGKNRMCGCNYQTVTQEESLLWYIKVMLAVDRYVGISAESILVICHEIEKQMKDSNDEYHFEYSVDATHRMAKELKCSWGTMYVILQQLREQKFFVPTEKENVYIAPEWLPILNSDFWDGLPKVKIDLKGEFSDK